MHTVRDTAMYIFQAQGRTDENVFCGRTKPTKGLSHGVRGGGKFLFTTQNGDRSTQQPRSSRTQYRLRLLCQPRNERVHQKLETSQLDLTGYSRTLYYSALLRCVVHVRHF